MPTGMGGDDVSFLGVATLAWVVVLDFHRLLSHSVCARGIQEVGSIAISNEVAAEIKDFARTFLKQNWPPKHLLRSVEEQLAGSGMCEICSGPCSILVPKHHIDLWIAGFPCQPFSKRRRTRFSSGCLS